ncbi:MAG: MBL fold metallo-hydrolase [Phycisphaerae bacterium]
MPVRTIMIDDQTPIEVTILGSGTSHGVPMIGCRCAVCTSSDPHDRRTRPSIWVRMGRQQILVDTSPELRLQCVSNGIDHLDAVLFTHHHADHVVGLDDLRRYNWLTQGAVPCYANERTVASLKRMFSYAFEPDPHSPHSRPNLVLKTIDAQPFSVGGQTIVPIPLIHGTLPVLGFRFGRFAYCTDCSFIPSASAALLQDLDVLVLDALRRTPHPAHFNLEQAIEAAKSINARRTYFTHITHELGHRDTNGSLPEGMVLAHDGLRFSVLSEAGNV